jgi:Asp-tRNA(Asn)/Glu-tRNA(Gln) amidotransferase A subunit family amidase
MQDVANDVEGAPCCVQVVGRHLQEEELLHNAEIISSVLHSGSVNSGEDEGGLQSLSKL